MIYIGNKVGKDLVRSKKVVLILVPFVMPHMHDRYILFCRLFLIIIVNYT